MKAVIAWQQYGKADVRLSRIIREADRHVFKEFTVSVLLEGGFDKVYEGDNSLCIPTDTCKNTVYVLAKDHKLESPESFALYITEHFLRTYAHVQKVNVTVDETHWHRMIIDGEPHTHSFTQGTSERRFTEVSVARNGDTRLRSGFKNLVVAKTTETAFTGFHRCQNTVLKDADDRIFATSITCDWDFVGNPRHANFNHVYETTRANVLRVFATTFSLSVQHTMRLMGNVVLGKLPSVRSLHCVMPNQHHLLFDLKPFGKTNKNEVFFPISAPAGHIEATMTRPSARL